MRFFFIIVANSFRSVETAQSFKIIIRLVVAMMGFLIFTHLLPRNKQMMENFISTMIISSSILLTVFIYRYMSHNSPYLSIGWNVSSGGIGRNQLAFYLTMVSPVVLWRYLSYNRLTSAWIIPVIIHLFALIYSMSRGSWVAFVVSLIFIASLIMAKKKTNTTASKHVFLKIASLIVITVCVLSFFGKSGIMTDIGERLSTRFLSLAMMQDTGKGHSIMDRLSQIRKGLIIFSNHPALGIGTSNFQYYRIESNHLTFNAELSAHNDYITILSEQGLVGLLVFLAMLFQVFRKIVSVKVITWNHAAYGQASIAIIIYMFFIDGSYLLGTYITFGILFAVDKMKTTQLSAVKISVKS